MRFWALDLNAWPDHFTLGICRVDRPPSILTMLLCRHTRPLGVVIDPWLLPLPVLAIDDFSKGFDLKVILNIDRQSPECRRIR